MEEQKRKRYRHEEQPDQNFLVAGAHHQQRKQAYNQDYEFRGDDVCQNGANEETFFSFEQRTAFGTVVPDMKRAFDER
ncbi:MAG: hypothetical protein QOF62_2027 [Pyrinomonadaceae bacterium]|nr:hypothetical protein [Pyrinomonadaceae bacterium]